MRKSRTTSGVAQWVQRAENSATLNNGTIQTAAFGSSTTTGNLIACAMTTNNGTLGISTVADTAGNSYTKAKSLFNVASTGYSQEVWYKENATGGASVKVTATWPATFNAYKGITCHEYSGMFISGAFDQAVTSSGFDSTIQGADLITNNDNELLFTHSFNDYGTAPGFGVLRSNSGNNAIIESFAPKRGTYQHYARNSHRWMSVTASFKRPALQRGFEKPKSGPMPETPPPFNLRLLPRLLRPTTRLFARSVPPHRRRFLPWRTRQETVTPAQPGWWATRD